MRGRRDKPALLRREKVETEKKKIIAGILIAVMTSETMFHEIVYYEDPDFFKDHQRIIFDTLEREGEYEVIAVFRFDTDHESFRFNRYTDMDMNEFAEFMKGVHERELSSIPNLHHLSGSFSRTQSPPLGCMSSLKS